MWHHQLRVFGSTAVFASLVAASAFAQEGVRPVQLEMVWESDAGPASARTCFPSSAPELQRQFAGDVEPEPKSRFIAITAGDPFHFQIVRVTWVEMPPWPTGHADLVGQMKWMLEPFQVCENSGQGPAVTPPDCGPAPGQPQRWFWAAALTCDPFSAWAGELASLSSYCTGSGEFCSVDADCAQGTCGVDGAIHLFDAGIAPSRFNANPVPTRYFVQVVDDQCSLFVEPNYSDPLDTATAGWGDVTGTKDCPAGPPDGDTNLLPDVIVTISKFSNNSCAPKKTRCDMDQDLRVDFPTDVMMVLNGFSNGGAGFVQPAPAVCP